jgi:hypothetical protein
VRRRERKEGGKGGRRGRERKGEARKLEKTSCHE